RPPPPISAENPVPDVDWRGKGIFGKWTHEVNGDCSFLTNEEERNWGFVGSYSGDAALSVELKSDHARRRGELGFCGCHGRRQGRRRNRRQADSGREGQDLMTFSAETDLGSMI